MEWAEVIGGAIRYVEEHITSELSIERIAKEVNVSPFYFQKGFSLLCGYTVAEYVRNRRLALAGSELASRGARVIDVALKYGYDSPDSFSKAFARFHGVSPAMAQRGDTVLRSFAPLKIKVIVEGGTSMEYRITQKDSFTVLGAAKTFRYDDAKTEIPRFWQEHYACGNGKTVCGMYGINIGDEQNAETFDYLIADNYDPASDVPDGFVTRVIPAHTWAVFPCRGALPDALQKVNAAIYAEWLPACGEYEIADGYCIEMYDDPAEYKKGPADEKYYCEMWIPVRKKA